MTEEQITEGNKLISEFMGGKMIVDDWDGISLIRFPDESIKHLGTLKYHSSWDQLMEAVEKIESIRIPQFAYGLELTMRGKRCVAITNVSSGKDIVNVGFADYNENVFYTKIEGVWLVVVKFIKWYNGTRTNH